MAHRTQIGAAWGYGDNGGGTTIPLASHDITAGSLVVVAFRHESSDTTMVVTDSASGTWSTAIGQFNGGVKVWLAYSYNHPGGTGIVITGTMGVSQSYRYGAAIELSGIDSTDPIQSGATVTSTTAPLDHSVSFTGDVDIFSIQGNFSGSSYGIVTGSIINSAAYHLFSILASQSSSPANPEHTGGTGSTANISVVISNISGASAVTASGPSYGAVGVASTNYTIGANDTPITGTVTVTPSDGGDGGTFTPTTVNISTGTPTATLTYTPASVGTKTISFTNNGGLANPSNLSYVVTTYGDTYLDTSVGTWGKFTASSLDSSGVMQTGGHNVIAAWGDAVVNTSGVYDGATFVSGSHLILWGGGHADYSGNEVYAYGPIGQSSRVWRRLRDKTSPAPEDVNEDGSGNPVSRHTYKSLTYIGATRNMMMATGGLARYRDSGSVTLSHTFQFNTASPNTNQPWTTRAAPTEAAIVSAYDSTTDKVWSCRTTSGNIQVYDCAANSYSDAYSKSPGFGTNAASAIDESRGLWGIYGTSGFQFYRLNAGTGNDYYTPSTTGTAPTGQGGIVWDEVDDRFVIWNGNGKQVFFLTPPSTSPYQGGNAWVWSSETAGTGETPTSQVSNGTFGRFALVNEAGKRMYVLQNVYTDDVYLYRPTSAVMEISRPSAITAGTWTDEAGGTLTVTDVNDNSDATGAMDVAGASYDPLPFTADTPKTATSQTFYFRGRDIVPGKQVRQVIFAADGTTVVATGAWHTMTGSLATYSDVLTPTATAYKGEIQTQAA